MLPVSAGVADSPRDANGDDQLIAAAEKVLYRAKETGRNFP